MSKTPLSAFARLNALVSIRRPDASPDSPPPRLIVICSWAEAAPKHIAKYTDGYQQLYPDATILLVQSRVISMLKDANLEPAVAVLASFDSDAASNRNVVLHAFSNGGARNATVLGTRFFQQHSHYPFGAVILDCCPGRADISSVSRAVTLSLPPGAFRQYVASWLVYFLVALFLLTMRALRLEDTVSLLRKSFNDPGLVPKSVPRLYLYSRADDMVRHGDVHAHAEEARKQGFESVSEECFDRAPHCALLLEDGERYWRAVRAQIQHGEMENGRV